MFGWNKMYFYHMDYHWTYILFDAPETKFVLLSRCKLLFVPLFFKANKSKLTSFNPCNHVCLVINYVHTNFLSQYIRLLKLNNGPTSLGIGFTDDIVYTFVLNLVEESSVLVLFIIIK